MNLKSLIASARKTLPSDDLRTRFDQMASTIKTPDDIPKVLDRLMQSVPKDPAQLEEETPSPAPRDLAGKVEVSSEQLLEKLRDAVQPHGKKGTWLRHLSDKRLIEIYHRLKMGQNIYQVVRIAQNEWNVMRSSHVKSLARAVRAFRDKTVGLLQVAPTIQTHGSTREERRSAADILGLRGKRIVKQLDGVGRLRWLIDVQSERVALLVEREEDALPFQITGDEVKTLGKLLSDYMKMQMDLGLIETKPHEFNVNVKHKFAGLLEHSVQGAGDTMAQAAGKYIELAEKEALTFELGHDGAYHMKTGEQDGDGVSNEGHPSGPGAEPLDGDSEEVRPIDAGGEDAGPSDSSAADSHDGRNGSHPDEGLQRLPIKSAEGDSD